LEFESELAAVNTENGVTSDAIVLLYKEFKVKAGKH
jgi:hypothetical protein